MPKFNLNKLVRDNYPALYINEGQKATYSELDLIGHKKALLAKVIEEVNEINPNSELGDNIGELADVFQALNDYMEISNIDKNEVDEKMFKKQEKFGSFLAGSYVKNIEIADDDPWVEYYRDRPDLFPEDK